MIYKKKPLIWIVLAIIVLVLVGAVIYLVWPKREANKPVENKSQTNWEEQLSQLKFGLNSTKSKLQKSEIKQKKQLEGRISEIEKKINESVKKQNSSLSQSEIKQLKEELKEVKQKLKESKPSNQKNDEPKPGQDKPSKNDKPKDKSPEDDGINENPNSDDSVSTIFKWSGSDESGYWTFVSRKERAIQIHIAKDHPFLKGKKLDSSEDTPLFGILFEKKNASKQEGNDTWYFDKDNNSFELDPFGDWPDEPEPNNKEEVKVEYAGMNIRTRDAYIFLLEEKKDYLFNISKNHPRIKQLLSQNKLQKDKKFTIRYGKIDKKSDNGLLFNFNEDNKELEIIEV